MTKKNSVAEAQATLQELQRTEADLCAQLAAVNDERELIAFEAITATSSPSKQRLAKLTDSASRLSGDIENVKHAITEARRRIAEAAAAEKREARCADAERALELAAELRAAGQLAGEALEAFAVRHSRVQEIATEMNALKIGFPTPALVRLACERGIATSLGPLGLAPVLQPSQRCSIPGVIADYAANAEGTARRILGGESGEEAA